METADVIIVGSGVAALQLAKELGTHKRVVILTKSTWDHGNSAVAQGGIAVAWENTDHPMNHYKDTLEAGRWINNRELVDEMTVQAPQLIKEWLDDGCLFDRTKDGELSLGLEGAHSNNRIIHAGGDTTGRVMMEFLGEKTKHIHKFENTFVYELMVESGQCIGVKALDSNNERVEWYAPHIVLATGGIGQLYSHTSNAATVTGDGIALAFRAGARIRDMEFIQFHPTLVHVDGRCIGLISEAVRGEGARLVRQDGTDIMNTIHHQGSLAPRHIVSKAVYDCLQMSEQVFLDISAIYQFEEKFPTITKLCKDNGLDLRDKLIPVVPGCHFLMGGIETDGMGKTSIPGLYAIGETACTGIHGANRLASNSLLEGLYMGKKLAQHLLHADDSLTLPALKRIGESKNTRKLPSAIEIKQSMQKHVGIVRNAKSIQTQLDWLESNQVNQLFSTPLDGLEAKEITISFMMICAWLITKSALLREESRGGHVRSDYPQEEEQWGTRKIILQRPSTGGLYEQTEVTGFTEVVFS